VAKTSDVPAHETRVFKTGNSLAVRIPNAIAKRLALSAGTPVDIAVANGAMRVARSTAPRLDDLVERITPHNVHGEQFDELAPRERW